MQNGDGPSLAFLIISNDCLYVLELCDWGRASGLAIMQCLGINTFHKIINYRITIAMIKMYSHNLLNETISS